MLIIMTHDLTSPRIRLTFTAHYFQISFVTYRPVTNLLPHMGPLPICFSNNSWPDSLALLNLAGCFDFLLSWGYFSSPRATILLVTCKSVHNNGGLDFLFDFVWLEIRREVSTFVTYKQFGMINSSLKSPLQ